MARNSRKEVTIRAATASSPEPFWCGSNLETTGGPVPTGGRWSRKACYGVMELQALEREQLQNARTAFARPVRNSSASTRLR
jgi:hypothetical protein